MEYLVRLMDQAIYGNTAARASLDMALHDLFGTLRSEPLRKTLGGRAESKGGD
ncbi:hypothetical protein KGY79_10550 [Candidatus Bipolaricaulota bacterium]|nr:hypothetical protein [Candidatus Bipolaricaulota bacterium]